MSKIGKMPIAITSEVSVTVQGHQVQVTGPKGNVSYAVPQGIVAEVVEQNLLITAKNLEDRKLKALYGLTRANLANVVKGVSIGFEKKLELVGVGYRAQMQGVDLVLSLGFSHPVKIKPQPGIVISVGDNNAITVAGMDKALVGEVAANIRKVRPPEPYKGKGIKYKGERVRRKAGKAAKAGSK
jgi:large subunit ribosomal protein L6